jgi:hypothetical protein
LDEFLSREISAGDNTIADFEVQVSRRRSSRSHLRVV